MNEIASIFVRLRPSFAGFKESATAGIKASLRETQTAVNTSARSNVTASASQINANKTLAASYDEVMLAAKGNVQAAVQGVTVNKALAAEYTQVAAAARAGSVEQIAATKLAAEASVGAATTVAEAARANIAVTQLEIRAQQELAAEYQLVAASAVKGSTEQIAAQRLAMQSSAATQAGLAATEARVGKLRGAFMGLGGALGLAFGVYEGIHFTKEVTQQAAEIQKFREVVESQFGEAGEAIRKWAEDGAAEFGITDDAALDTASRFGILFRNLGIGQEEAAKMTIGFEKLAGSLSAIRGKNPEDVMQKIVLAAAGNTRGLKQLGIVVDQTQIKYVALKLGLISTLKDAITPGIKAQAIYAISTQNLGKYLEDAKRHSEDYANVQRRLSAQWDNTKDVIGEGLLPAFSSLANFLARYMPSALKYTMRAFGDLAADVRQFVGFVRPAFEALAGSTTGTRIALGALAASFTVLFAAAFPITSVVLGIAALGIAFREAYNHSARFRAGVHAVGQAVKEDIVPAFQDAVAYVQGIWDDWGATIKRVTAADLGAVVGYIRGTAKVIVGVWNVLTGILTLDWRKTWGGLKQIVSGSLGAVQAVIKGWAQTVQAVFEGVWDNLKSSLLRLELWVLEKLAAIPTKISTPFGDIGFENPFKGLAEGLRAELDAVANGKAIEDARDRAMRHRLADNPQVLEAANASGRRVGEEINKGMEFALAPTTGEKQALAGLETRLRQSIAKQTADVRKAVNDAKTNLTSLAGSMAASLSTAIDQPFVVAGQKIQEAQNRINLLFDRKSQKLNAQAAEITRQQQQIAAAGNRLALDQLRQSVVLPGGARVSGDPKVALAQLKELEAHAGKNSGAISAFVNQFRSAVLQVQSDKVSAKQAALDAKKTVLTSQLQLRTEVLAVEQDTATRLKTAITRQIGDLTDAFNRHVITYAQFKSGIDDIVSKGAPAMRAAGKTLGTAFAEQYAQQVADTLKQAGFIAEGPQVVGANGPESKIVNPAVVARKDQAATDKIRTQIANKQTLIQERIARETKKSADYLRTIAGDKATKTPTSGEKNPGTQTRTSRDLRGSMR